MLAELRRNRSASINTLVVPAPIARLRRPPRPGHSQAIDGCIGRSDSALWHPAGPTPRPLPPSRRIGPPRQRCASTHTHVLIPCCSALFKPPTDRAGERHMCRTPQGPEPARSQGGRASHDLAFEQRIYRRENLGSALHNVDCYPRSCQRCGYNEPGWPCSDGAHLRRLDVTVSQLVGINKRCETHSVRPVALSTQVPPVFYGVSLQLLGRMHLRHLEMASTQLLLYPIGSY